MALPMAPPMIRPIQMAASDEVARASQTARAIEVAKAKRMRPQRPKLAPLLEHPVAHSLVPDEHEVEEWGELTVPLAAMS